MATSEHGQVPIVIGFFPSTRPDVSCGEWRAVAVEAGRPLLNLADIDVLGQAQ